MSFKAFLILILNLIYLPTHAHAASSAKEVNSTDVAASCLAKISTFKEECKSSCEYYNDSFKANLPQKDLVYTQLNPLISCQISDPKTICSASPPEGLGQIINKYEKACLDLGKAQADTQKSAAKIRQTDAKLQKKLNAEENTKTLVSAKYDLGEAVKKLNSCMQSAESAQSDLDTLSEKFTTELNTLAETCEKNATDKKPPNPNLKNEIVACRKNFNELNKEYETQFIKMKPSISALQAACTQDKETTLGLQSATWKTIGWTSAVVGGVGLVGYGIYSLTKTKKEKPTPSGESSKSGASGAKAPATTSGSSSLASSSPTIISNTTAEKSSSSNSGITSSPTTSTTSRSLFSTSGDADSKSKNLAALENPATSFASYEPAPLSSQSSPSSSNNSMSALDVTKEKNQKEELASLGGSASQGSDSAGWNRWNKKDEDEKTDEAKTDSIQKSDVLVNSTYCHKFQKDLRCIEWRKVKLKILNAEREAKKRNTAQK